MTAEHQTPNLESRIPRAVAPRNNRFARLARGIVPMALLVTAVAVNAQNAAPKTGPVLTNSLGLRFVPVGEVLFSTYETRVGDFAAFVKASGYEATAGVYTMGARVLEWRGKTWNDIGWPTDAHHPVVGVSWEDAFAFCAWLTEHERKLGKIGTNQIYRLPTDSEWTAALWNVTVYP